MTAQYFTLYRITKYIIYVIRTLVHTQTHTQIIVSLAASLQKRFSIQFIFVTGFRVMFKSIILFLGLLFLFTLTCGQFKYQRKYGHLRKSLKSLGKIEIKNWAPEKICKPKLIVDYFCYTCFCDKNGEMALCKSNGKCKNVKPYAMYPDSEISEEQFF